MSSKNLLLSTPPYEVEADLRQLGADIRTARLRRNLSLASIAEKLGVSRKVLADVEAGKSSTGIGIYAGVLWALGLSSRLGKVADPVTDEVGQALAAHQGRKGAGRPRRTLSNDF